MPFNHFENYIFEIDTLRSLRTCPKQCHICSDRKVRSHCHLVVKVRNRLFVSIDTTFENIKVHHLILAQGIELRIRPGQNSS